jgi:hypothetical protein
MPCSVTEKIHPMIEFAMMELGIICAVNKSKQFVILKIWISTRTSMPRRSPNSRRFLRTVWPEIWTSVRPGVLRAESSAVIIRFQKWIRRTCLSWRYDGTRGLSLRGLSFVLPASLETSHTWQLSVFSNEFRFSLRFSDGRIVCTADVGKALWTSVCMSPNSFGGGSVMVWTGICHDALLGVT